MFKSKEDEDKEIEENEDVEEYGDNEDSEVEETDEDIATNNEDVIELKEDAKVKIDPLQKKDLRVMSSESMKIMELSNRIAKQDTNIRDLTTMVGELSEEIIKLKGIISLVERELDTAVIVDSDRPVPSLVESMATL